MSAKEGGSTQKRVLAALCALAAGLVVITAGCGNKAPQASRALAAKITHDSSQLLPAAPDPAKASEEKRVYLDASLSMKGFVNPTNHSRFDEFLDAIGYALPECQLYKYGQRATKTGENNQSVTERARFGLELHRPEFYDRLYNPDDRLIEQLASEERPALSVLITDGVYSEPQGATSPPVVEAIKKWMAQGNVFGVIMLKSRFDGPFYSEHQRRMLAGFPPIAARPFYAFVFSPTMRAFKELRENLGRRFPPDEMQTFLFSDDAVSCIPKLDPGLKGIYSSAAPPQAPYYWQMFNTKLFEQQNPARVQYGLDCTISETYPIVELNFDAAREYYRWGKGGFEKAEGPPGNFKAVASSNAAAPGLTVDFPKDGSSDYGFYYLRLIPSPKSFRPEIESGSTQDDQLPSEAEKTFRFFELMTSLANAHFKARVAPRTSPAIFVTITNH